MVLVATHKALGNIKEDAHFYGAANAADSLDELQDKLEEVYDYLKKTLEKQDEEEQEKRESRS